MVTGKKKKRSRTEHALVARWHVFTSQTAGCVPKYHTAHINHKHPPHTGTHTSTQVHKLTSGPNAVLSSMDNPRVNSGFQMQAAYPIIYQIITFHENQPVIERHMESVKTVLI